ncbi:unnamed protein product [Urochloa humidicola]
MAMGGRPVNVNPLHTTPNEIRKIGTKRHRLMFRRVGGTLGWILLRPLRPRRRTEQWTGERKTAATGPSNLAEPGASRHELWHQVMQMS